MEFHRAVRSATIAQATLCRQQDRKADVYDFSMYDRSPTVTTTLRKRRKPSSIDACKMLVISLEKATSGELAILRISPANIGSQRTTPHSSDKELSVPAITLSARSATAGNGGSLFKAGSISSDLADVGLATRVPIKPDNSTPYPIDTLNPPCA
jgi:hypothetical protein